MKQPNVTPWFDGNDKPARRGVYQRDFSMHRTGADVAPCLWDGAQWRVWGDTAQEAARSREHSAYQSLPWRGLAEQPKGGA